MTKKQIEVILWERGEIKIGENIYITLIDSKKGRCKIGIDAPDDVKITRADRIHKPTHEE